MAIYQQPLKGGYSIYQRCMAQYQILQLMLRDEYYIHFIDKEPYFSTLSSPPSPSLRIAPTPSVLFCPPDIYLMLVM